MYLLIFLGILADIGVTIVSKWTLARQRIPSAAFNSLQFWFLAFFSTLFLWKQREWDLIGIVGSKNLALFGVMIAFAWAWNWLNTQVLKRERIEQYELIWMSIPLFTVLFSGLFLAQERSPRLFWAAVLVSLILIATHFKRSHLHFLKYDKWLILAVILVAFEAIAIKLLLSVWSAPALYFARTFVLALVFTLASPPKLKNITKSQWLGLAGVGVFGAIFKIIQYTAYDQLGVVVTTMALVLSPILILALDRLILKERLHFRYAAGIALIGGTVAWALGAWETVVFWLINLF